MWFLAVLLLLCGGCEGRDVTFDMSGYNPKNGSSVMLKKIVEKAEGFIEVLVTKVPDDLGFFVIQVHSFPFNVTFSDSSNFKSNNTVKGTNVGLVSFKKGGSSFYVTTKNSTQLLIAIVGYDSQDPIPGGCNLEFETEYAPYQKVSYTDDVITVLSQPPSAFSSTCDKNNITVDLYHFYLKQYNYDSSYYFDVIGEMFLTANDIKKNGYKVTTMDKFDIYRKLYSAYRGTGQVFAIVATHIDRSSAYIPAISYGCDITNEKESCTGPVTIQWKIICALLLIFGFFVTSCGHIFFRTTIFLTSCTVGIFTTYVVVSLDYSDLTNELKSNISIGVGVLCGIVWLIIWWKYGIPILTIGSTFLSAGFLIASLVFNAGLGDLTTFHNDVNFWSLFIAITILFHFIFTLRFPLWGHVSACCFLGSYAFVTSLNYYIGGNLQYILINSYRRIVVKDFNRATIELPYRMIDLMHTCLWNFLLVFGVYVQRKRLMGKPPFPPHRATAAEEIVVESAPLLSSTESAVIYSDE